MSYAEDKLNEVFEEVKGLGVRKEFDAQLKKMSYQNKHKYKRVHEKWEYALYRIKGGMSRDDY
tara:strand:+ start:179 stop:367 length:189 start_codon:yes stop_codon:yes gene_type:complete